MPPRFAAKPRYPRSRTIARDSVFFPAYTPPEKIVLCYFFILGFKFFDRLKRTRGIFAACPLLEGGEDSYISAQEPG